MKPLIADVVGEDGVYLLTRTSQSNVQVAQAARTQAFLDGKRVVIPRKRIEEPGYIGQELQNDEHDDGRARSPGCKVACNQESYGVTEVVTSIDRDRR